MSICCSAHRPEDTAEIMFQQHLLSMAPFLPPAVRSTFPSLTWHNSAGPSGSLCNFCRALWLVLLPVEIAVPQRTGSVAVYFLPCTQGFLCTKLEVYKCEIHAEEGTRMPQDKVPPQYSYFSIKRINVTCKEPYFWRVPWQKQYKHAPKRKRSSALEDSYIFSEERLCWNNGWFLLQKSSIFFTGRSEDLAMLRSLFDLALRAFSLCQNKTLLFMVFSYLDVQETNFEFCK